MNYSNQARLFFSASFLVFNVVNGAPSQVLVTNASGQDVYLAPYYCVPGKEAVRAGQVQVCPAGSKLMVQRPDKHRQGKWSPFFYKRQLFVATDPQMLEQKFNDDIPAVHTLKIGDFSPSYFKISANDMQRANISLVVAPKTSTDFAQAVPQQGKKHKAVTLKAPSQKAPADRMQDSIARLSKLDEARKRQDIAQQRLQAAHAAKNLDQVKVELSTAVEAEGVDVDEDFDDEGYLEDKDERDLDREIAAIDREIQRVNKELEHN